MTAGLVPEPRDGQVLQEYGVGRPEGVHRLDPAAGVPETTALGVPGNAWVHRLRRAVPDRPPPPRQDRVVSAASGPVGAIAAPRADPRPRRTAGAGLVDGGSLSLGTVWQAA